MLALASAAFAQDVRRVAWGMSRQQVIEIEGNDFLDRQRSGLAEVGFFDGNADDELVYRRTALGYRARVFYDFSGDQLFSARFTVYALNREAAFEKWSAALSSRYGRPAAGTAGDVWIWKTARLRVILNKWAWGVEVSYHSDLLYQRRKAQAAGRQGL